MFAPMGAYDRAITVFSPDGRLFQVEYAVECVKRGPAAIGVKAVDGVVLVTERKILSKLMEPSTVEKIFKIDDHIAAAMAGLYGDARVLIDRARLEAQINRLTYSEPITVEALTKRIADYQQLYTQHAGVRPFGVQLIIAGVDDDVKLYVTHPSGSFYGYKACAVGANYQVIREFLEKEYRDGITVEEAILLAIRALVKASKEELTPERIEIAVITKKDKMFRKLPEEEVKKYFERAVRGGTG